MASLTRKPYKPFGDSTAEDINRKQQNSGGVCHFVLEHPEERSSFRDGGTSCYRGAKASLTPVPGWQVWHKTRGGPHTSAVAAGRQAGYQTVPKPVLSPLTQTNPNPDVLL